MLSEKILIYFIQLVDMGGMKMIFENGYTFKKVRTSHGSNIYVSQFGQVIKVVPCGSQMSLSEIYVSNLIRQIESMD